MRCWCDSRVMTVADVRERRLSKISSASHASVEPEGGVPPATAVPPKPSSPSVAGVRHVQALLTMGCLCMSYLLRLNLSVAVVQMVTSPESKVEMSSGMKGMVLSSFFWGYGLLQVVFGSLGRRGYATRLLAGGLVVSGALSLLLPFVGLHTGPIGIIVLRFFMGLVQGTVYPNIYNMLAKWVIPQEKEISSVVLAGQTLGSVMAMVICGYVGYHYDWPAIFYLTGTIGITWGVLTYVAGAECMDTCKYISKGEKEYMKQSFAVRDGKVSDEDRAKECQSRVPWTSILRSGPVAALLAMMWCNAWGGWTLATLSPTYISAVLGFDLEDDGLLSALPYISTFVCGCLVPILNSFLQKKFLLPDKVSRFGWSSLGGYGMAISLLLLAYLDTNAAGAIGLLVAAAVLQSFFFVGHGVNHLDLSPSLAGVIMSLTNSISNTASIIGPLLSTALVHDPSEREEWRIVFVMAAGLYSVGTTVFLFWGSTERQPWDPGQQLAPSTGV